MRAADGVGDHQAQSDAGMPEQGGTDGGVTVQVEIGLHRRCYLRARQFRGFRAVAALGAAGFLGGEIAFVEVHFAGRTDIDLDETDTALACTTILPRQTTLRQGRETVKPS